MGRYSYYETHTRSIIMRISQLLLSIKFCKFLFILDKLLLALIKAKPCTHCGAKLHIANYKRKIYNNNIVAPELFELRFSVCCSRCRKRCVVPSIRFFNRRGVCALHFILTLLFLQKNTKRNREKLKNLLPISANTILRWRKFFFEQFQELAGIKALKAQQTLNQSWCIKFFLKNSLEKGSLLMLSKMLIVKDEFYIKIVSKIKGMYTHAEDG